LAVPLSPEQRASLDGFFLPQVLDTRLLVLAETRVENPAFYPLLRQMGFTNLPNFTTMAAVTFGDVVVSHQPFSDGLLFHELVHVEQYRRLNRRGMAAVTVAAVIPDIDGIGIVAEVLTRHSSHPLLWFSEYHHALHSLAFAVVVAILTFTLTRSWLTAGLAFIAFHLHLLEDLVGSRGPDGFIWPVPYLQPFTSQLTWSWGGQWQLNAWPNLALTLFLLAITIWIAVVRGVSPVFLFSVKADAVVVEALRRRLGYRVGRLPGA